MRKFVVSCAAVAFLFGIAEHSQAEFIVDFTITDIQGGEAATISGEILGLSPNGSNQQASEVVLNPFTSPYPETASHLIYVQNNPVFISQGLNDFTTTNGVLTSGYFFEEGFLDSHDTHYSSLTLAFGPTATSWNLYYYLHDYNNILPDIGGGGYLAHAVPEPSSFALLGLGGIGLVIGAYRRRFAVV